MKKKSIADDDYSANERKTEFVSDNYIIAS